MKQYTLNQDEIKQYRVRANKILRAAGASDDDIASFGDNHVMPDTFFAREFQANPNETQDQDILQILLTYMGVRGEMFETTQMALHKGLQQAEDKDSEAVVSAIHSLNSEYSDNKNLLYSKLSSEENIEQYSTHLSFTDKLKSNHRIKTITAAATIIALGTTTAGVIGGTAVTTNAVIGPWVIGAIAASPVGAGIAVAACALAVAVLCHSAYKDYQYSALQDKYKDDKLDQALETQLKIPERQHVKGDVAIVGQVAIVNEVANKEKVNKPETTAPSTSNNLGGWRTKGRGKKNHLTAGIGGTGYRQKSRRGGRG